MTFPPSADRVEPCPYCRGTASVQHWSRGIGLDNERGFMVCCEARDCGASGERVIEGAGESEAIRSWNRVAGSASKAASAAVEIAAKMLDDEMEEWLLKRKGEIVASAVEKAKGGGPDAG